MAVIPKFNFVKLLQSYLWLNISMLYLYLCYNFENNANKLV